jgi:hypothetical protein
VLLCVALGLLCQVVGVEPGAARLDEPRCSSDPGDDGRSPLPVGAPHLLLAVELDADGDGLLEHASAWSPAHLPTMAIQGPVADSHVILTGPGRSRAPAMDRGPPRPHAEAGDGRSPRWIPPA